MMTYSEIADAIMATPENNGVQFLDLPTGHTLEVRVENDLYHHLSDDGDWFGRLDHSNPRCNYTGYSIRPNGFNGNAEKLQTRNGFIWWQPPADVKRGTDSFDSLRRIVAGYYLEHWYFVAVSGRLVDSTGRQVASDHIGGVSSDDIVEALLDYIIPEIVSDNLLQAIDLLGV